MAKLKNQDFIIRGTGKPLRQFIYSEDLAKIIMILFNKNINYDNIIISSPEDSEISIGAVGKIIAKNYDYEHRIIFDSNFSDGQYKKTVSTNKLYNIIGDFEYTSIEDGINNSVKWFIENKINQ